MWGYRLPVVVGEVFDNGQRDSVRAAIQAVAAESPTIRLVSSEGTTTSDPGTHFDTKSQLLWAERYANVMMELPTSKPTTVPAPIGQNSIDRPNVLFIAVDDLNDWQVLLVAIGKSRLHISTNCSNRGFYLRTPMPHKPFALLREIRS